MQMQNSGFAFLTSGLLAAAASSHGAPPDAGPSCPSFPEGISYDYDTTRGVAVRTGDLDGDGDADLAYCGGGSSSSVTVLRNAGCGCFSLADVGSVGTNPDSIAMGDLDGDGDLDLATANDDGDNVSVLLNEGDATFDHGVAYGAGLSPTSIAMGDLDGDGDLDLAVSNRQGDNVSILLNEGDGTFADDITYAVGALPQSLAIGDLDGDGDLDVAAVTWLEGVCILMNHGDGTFAPFVSYGEFLQLSYVGIDDVDADGDRDLVIAGATLDGLWTVSVMLNAGDGTFPSTDYLVPHRPDSFAFGDLDGDGDRDLAVVLDAGPSEGDLLILLNDGDGTFAEHATYTIQNLLMSVATEDLNGDGALDIALGLGMTFSKGVSVMMNAGCTSPCPADIDGSGSVGLTDLLEVLDSWGQCSDQ